MADMMLALVAVFASVALLTGAAASAVLSRTAAGRRRLFALQMPQAQPPSAGGVLSDAPNPRANKLSTYVPKSPKEMTRLQRRLAEAGFHGFTPVLDLRVLRDRVGGNWIRDGVGGAGSATGCDIRRRRGGAGLHGARLHRRPPHPTAQEADRERAP